MKVCSKCKVPKEESNFRKDKQKKDGLRPDCKSCGRKLRLVSIKSKVIETEEHKKTRLKKFKETVLENVPDTNVGDITESPESIDLISKAPSLGIFTYKAIQTT